MVLIYFSVSVFNLWTCSWPRNIGSDPDQGILCVHVVLVIVVVVWISGLVSDGICNMCRIMM